MCSAADERLLGTEWTSVYRKALHEIMGESQRRMTEVIESEGGGGRRPPWITIQLKLWVAISSSRVTNTQEITLLLYNLSDAREIQDGKEETFGCLARKHTR